MHKRFLLELTGIGSIGVKWALSLGKFVVDFLFCLSIFFKKIEYSSFYPDVPTSSIITYWTCKFTLALPDSCQVSSRALPISSLFWNFGTKALLFCEQLSFFFAVSKTDFAIWGNPPTHTSSPSWSGVQLSRKHGRKLAWKMVENLSQSCLAAGTYFRATRLK